MSTEVTKLSSEMGKALVEEAQALHKKMLMDQCVGEVQVVMAHIARLESGINESDRQLDIFRRRLAAIEAGEIGFTSEGRFNVADPHSGGPVRIAYNEKALRPENAGC